MTITMLWALTQPSSLQVCYLEIRSHKTKYRMESSSWPENLPSCWIKAIQELTKGQALANKLRELLDQPEKIESEIKSVNGVVEQILGMFDNTLSILSSSNFNGISYNPINTLRSIDSWDDQKSKDSDKSIKTKIPVKTKRGCYQRRKNASTITQITSTLTDDGYAWRKYGQKAILNSKHQRNYYRCSHKLEQGCQATKQIQMTDDKPSKYKITYTGVHTCHILQSASQIIMEASNPRDNSTLISFKTDSLVENNTSGTCFSYMKHTPKEGFLFSDKLKQEQVSLSDPHTPWDSSLGVSQIPPEPMSMLSSGLECEDRLSSGVFSSACGTNFYGIDNMIESHDFGELLSEFAHS